MGVVNIEVTPPVTVPGDMAGSKVIFSEATTVVVSPVEMSNAEAITIRDTNTKAVKGEVISNEITSTVTSAPPGNDHNSSFSNQFSYTVFDLKNFTGIIAIAALISGPSQEVVTIP